MIDLSEQEKQEVIRFIEADKPLPDKYRFLLFGDKREIIHIRVATSGTTEHTENPQSAIQNPQSYEEACTGDYIFENEWQSFRTKRDRLIEFKSVFHE